MPEDGEAYCSVLLTTSPSSNTLGTQSLTALVCFARRRILPEGEFLNLSLQVCQLVPDLNNPSLSRSVQRSFHILASVLSEIFLTVEHKSPNFPHQIFYI
jgi:hypothetical protein